MWPKLELDLYSVLEEVLCVVAGGRKPTIRSWWSFGLAGVSFPAFVETCSGGMSMFRQPFRFCRIVAHTYSASTHDWPVVIYLLTGRLSAMLSSVSTLESQFRVMTLQVFKYGWLYLAQAPVISTFSDIAVQLTFERFGVPKQKKEQSSRTELWLPQFVHYWRRAVCVRIR